MIGYRPTHVDQRLLFASRYRPVALQSTRLIVIALSARVRPLANSYVLSTSYSRMYIVDTRTSMV